MLSQYDLSLVSRPHYGMMIKGATFKKVLLTIRMYRYFDKNASNDFGIPEYSAFFYCDNCEKEKIRQTFFNQLLNLVLYFPILMLNVLLYICSIFVIKLCIKILSR
jgi:lichenan operon transcriptional antiterminator